MLGVPAPAASERGRGPGAPRKALSRVRRSDELSASLRQDFSRREN